ncbi:MAG: hypothetical protein AAF446_06185 [Pseudomonadota bacterium]
MMQEKVNTAIKMLSTETCVGVHRVNDNILSTLHEKHPPCAPIQENSLLQGPMKHVLPVYFDSIDETMILKAASQTKGAGGPSQLDALQYHHMLSSRKYKVENKELRTQMALLAQKLATEVIDPSTLEAYTAYQLIPLNKNPGIRPIGVGEILRRIIGKCIGLVLTQYLDAGSHLRQRIR